MLDKVKNSSLPVVSIMLLFLGLVGAGIGVYSIKSGTANLATKASTSGQVVATGLFVKLPDPCVTTRCYQLKESSDGVERFLAGNINRKFLGQKVQIVASEVNGSTGSYWYVTKMTLSR